MSYCTELNASVGPIFGRIRWPPAMRRSLAQSHGGRFVRRRVIGRRHQRQRRRLPTTSVAQRAAWHEPSAQTPRSLGNCSDGFNMPRPWLHYL